MRVSVDSSPMVATSRFTSSLRSISVTGMLCSFLQIRGNP